MTTKHLELKAEILTVNGWVPISFRIAPGGHYFIEEALRYHNLEDLINSGSIEVVSENSTPLVSTEDTEDKEPDIPVGVSANEITESDILVEVPANDGVSVNEITESDIPVGVSADDKVSEDGITEPDSVDSEEQEIPAVESNDSDEFVCPHCGATYATQRGLSRHMNSEHPHE